MATTSYGTLNAATAHHHSTNNNNTTDNSNNNSTNNITYHAIISHAIPCDDVLLHDGTGAAIDTVVSESARNASGGSTNEESNI